jgi:hypothetical protein
VSLKITTEPEGAELSIDGVKSGATPAALELERSTRSRELKLEKLGYVTVTRRVVADIDRELHVGLTQEVSQVAATAPLPVNSPRATPRATAPMKKPTKPAAGTAPATTKPQFGRFP